jgi:hypothetical protein
MRGGRGNLVEPVRHEHRRREKEHEGRHHQEQGNYQDDTNQAKSLLSPHSTNISTMLRPWINAEKYLTNRVFISLSVFRPTWSDCAQTSQRQGAEIRGLPLRRSWQGLRPSWSCPRRLPRPDARHCRNRQIPKQCWERRWSLRRCAGIIYNYACGKMHDFQCMDESQILWSSEYESFYFARALIRPNSLNIFTNQIPFKTFCWCWACKHNKK